MIKSIKSEFINYNCLNLNEHIFELHEMFLDEFLMNINEVGGGASTLKLYRLIVVIKYPPPGGH